MRFLEQAVTADSLSGPRLGAAAGLPAPVAAALLGLDPGDALLSRAFGSQTMGARIGLPPVPGPKPTQRPAYRPSTRTRTSLMPGGQSAQETHPPVPPAKPVLFPPTPSAKPQLPEPDPNLGGANPTYDSERVAQFLRDYYLAAAMSGSGAASSLIAGTSVSPALIGSAALYAVLALMSGFGNSVEPGYGQNPIGS